MNDNVKHSETMRQLERLGAVEDAATETEETTVETVEKTEPVETEEVEVTTETEETTETTTEDETDTDTTSDNSILSYLTHKFGEVEVNTDGLEPDDIEVAERYIEAIVPKKVSEKAVEVLREFPEVEGLYNHLKQGYSVDSWNQINTPDVYGNITIADDDVKTAETIFREAQKLRGLNEKQIDRLVEAAKDDASLIEDSREELTFLQEIEKKQKENILLAEKEAHEQAIKNNAEVWKQTEAIINKGSFAGITLPKTEADAFYSDLAYRGKDGKDATKVEKIWQDISLEEEIAVNWFLVGLREGKFKNGFTLKNSTEKPVVRTKAKIAGAGTSKEKEEVMSTSMLQSFYKGK